MSLHALVPVKGFALAKQRLRGCCSPAERALLARLMLLDVLDTLRAHPALQGVAIVTADAEAAALARPLGVRVFDEPRPGGLNPALAAAAQSLQARGCLSLLVLPGDVPGVQPGELSHLFAAHGVTVPSDGAPVASARLTLVPAHDRRGTNAMLLSPPTALAPAYGGDSFDRHRRAARQAGLPTRTLELAGLGLDLDHGVDLQRFLAQPTPTRTWRFLASILSGRCRRAARPAPALSLSASPSCLCGAPRSAVTPHASLP